MFHESGLTSRIEMMSPFTLFFFPCGYFLSGQFCSAFSSRLQRTHASDHNFHNDRSPLSTLAQEEASILTLCHQTMPDVCRPKSNPLVKSLDALMAASVRSTMTSWLPMDELLRSGHRPKPQHWKSGESTEAEETSAEEDRDWNDDTDADWTIDSEDHSSLSGGSLCALVASDGRASLRRSISETELSVSEEKVNQTFTCWKEDLVGVTGLFGPVVDELFLASVCDHCWNTEQ